MAFPPKLHPFATPTPPFPSPFKIQRKHFPYTNQSHHSTNPSKKILLSFIKSVPCSLHHSPTRNLFFNVSKPNFTTFKTFSTLPEDYYSADDAALKSVPLSTQSTGFLRNAGLISAATVASKILGLLREIVLAAVFGVGPVTTAFNHALVLPSFFASLLGGVNGPIHITMVTTSSKLSNESRRHLLQNAHAVMLLAGGVLGALTYVFAELIIYVSAPGLWALAEGRVIREIAVTQLKLMTPCILFAGPVALGFGCLSAEGYHLIPSLSPALSSIALIVSCAIYLSISGSDASHPGDALTGGKLISYGASLGVLLQWFIQVVMHKKTGYGFISFSWKDILKDKDLHKLFMLMLPATLSSGLAQIASFTDLYFASFIPGAAAGLSYARLLAMAPSGILLSTVLLPLLPTFSRLEKPSSWPSLTKNIQQVILLLVALVLPITSSICFLSEPIITVLFQRFTFDSAASALVSTLLIWYSVGSPFYIIRELLVMVFYVLGDGQQPFIISVAAILLNAFLDWLFIFKINLGAQGLVLSTSFVTTLSTLLLLHLLSKKLGGLLDFSALVGPLLLLLACCIISGFTTLFTYTMLGPFLSSLSIIRFCRFSELLSISIAIFFGMVSFLFPLVICQFPGLNMLKDLFSTLLN
ncbi:uncharacterized protein LOC143862240 isoform X2 [Tasmannia lanceolata]|uniref:uncharacterized protein LOC143862240 isoform X2 n=1 Tax=Tasmannia lanceolata TaxID=3420 RepID=UPI0040642C8F